MAARSSCEVLEPWLESRIFHIKEIQVDNLVFFHREEEEFYCRRAVELVINHSASSNQPNERTRYTAQTIDLC